MDVEQLIFRSDFHKCRKIFRALVARALLFSHACLSVWFASQIDQRYYAIYAATGVLFLVETIAILYFRYGCEWKRFCTTFICYLITMITVMWILHRHDIDLYLAEKAKSSSNTTSSTTSSTASSTDTSNVINETSTTRSPLNTLLGKDVGTLLNDQTLTSLLEQSMMILLIICRWLLPRGRIDRNSLSQLLIMLSAISADILDFSDILGRKEVIEHEQLSFVVMGVWSWSLLQFTVVTTTAFTFRRRQRQPDLSNQSSTDSEDKSETISVIMVFFMQDGPFLVTRCYAISLGVLDYMILFFSLKNLMTLILGLYRLMVLMGCIAKEGNDLLRKSEIARSMDSLDDWGPPRKTKRVKNGNKHVEFVDEDTKPKGKKSKGKQGKTKSSKVQKY